MGQRPVQQEITKREDKHASQYVSYMGCAPELDLRNLVGDFSVGHQLIPRRVLVNMESLQVGCRIENALPWESLTNDAQASDWHKNPARVITKSAQDCVSDLNQLHGREGLTHLRSLTGVDYTSACELFES